MKIAFLPIDNRPVCYTLAKDIAGIDREIEFFIPPRKLLGDLKRVADIEGLISWLENLPQIDSLILSLDTLVYGGLIPSRRSKETLEELQTRLERIKPLLRNKNVYAFSSIMRISNNNVNEEEKEYWSKWGKKIFEYSYQTHKLGTESCITNVIPSEILDDYIATRKRNFEINKLYLEYQKQGLFNTLVFSKDDCAEYGFNVQEAKALEKLGGFVKTGADEIPLTLLARAIMKKLKPVSEKETSRVGKTQCSHRDKRQETGMKIAPIFLVPECKDLISNYEDVSIEKSVKGQIELAGCSVCEPDDADILLYVNNFEDHQGEIVMKVPTQTFSGKWQKPSKPYMVADVRFANGADNAFVKQLFEVGFDENFLGYSAWNTSANSLGSLICGAIVFKGAKMQNNVGKDFYFGRDFLKLQTVRLLDDWAYQANVRQQLTSPDEKLVKELMKPYEEKVFEVLGVNYDTSYKFPWNRLFEVEVCI